MSDLLPGDVFAGFEITEVVGRDELSVVYLAIEGTLRRTVALRIMAPEVSEDAAFREHFTHEARMAASVDHPNVVTVYRFGEDRGQLYMAMRHVEGTTLASVLADGPLPTERTVAVIGAVASALDAVHSAGVVHRNVRPVNILIGRAADGSERVLLAGFGAAQPGTRTSLTSQGRLGGAVAYAAPELLQDLAVTPATDVYSLACVLFACLTGQPPFPRPTHAEAIAAQLEARPPSISAIRPDLPSSLDVLFEYALAKDPTARYQSAGELVRAMRPTLLPDRATPTPLPTPMPSAVFTPPPAAAPGASEPTHVPTPRPAPPTAGADATDPVAAAADAPAASDGNATPTLAPSPLPLPAEPGAGRRRRPRAVLAVSAIFVILVAAAGAGVVLSRQTVATAATKLRLNTVLAGNDIRAERTWAIDGPDGDHFTGVITLTNLGPNEVRHAQLETLPKEIAASAKSYTFDPVPFSVVDDDPVVRWCLTIPAHGTTTLSYTTSVAPGGVANDRLKAWADTWWKAIHEVDATRGQLCDKTDVQAGAIVNDVTPAEQSVDAAAGSVPPSTPDTVSELGTTTTASTALPQATVPTTVRTTSVPTTGVFPTTPTSAVPVTHPPVPGAPGNVTVSNPVTDRNLSEPYCGGIPQRVTLHVAWSPASGTDHTVITVSRWQYTGGAPVLLAGNVQTSGALTGTGADLTVPRSDDAQSYYVYTVTAYNSEGAGGSSSSATATAIMPNVINVCSWTMWQMLRTVGLPPIEDQTVVGTDENRVYNQTFAAGSPHAPGTLAPVKSYKSP